MKITESFIPVEGHLIAVQAANETINTTPIIFIHGVLASYKFWNEVLPEEIRENRCWYSVSLPGHHPSDVPKAFNAKKINEQWFAKYLDEVVKRLVGDKDYILAGHSTGGFAILNYASTQPERLKGVISIAGFYKGDWGGIEGALVKLAALGSWAKPLFIANLALGRLSFPVQRWLSKQLAYNKKAYIKSSITNKMLKCIQPLMQQQKLANLFPLFNRIKFLNIIAALKNIAVPTYIFAGNKDPVISAEQSLILASYIPDTKTIAFDQVGHMPFMETEDQFSSDFIAAINQLSDS
ncbi:MAG: alpha/beta hydrolase [Proteobacteria bacterium]|nr:alpha/beta hydrolase [Pseudomonadota bacterium]